MLQEELAQVHMINISNLSQTILLSYKYVFLEKMNPRQHWWENNENWPATAVSVFNIRRVKKGKHPSQHDFRCQWNLWKHKSKYPQILHAFARAINTQTQLCLLQLSKEVTTRSPIVWMPRRGSGWEVTGIPGARISRTQESRSKGWDHPDQSHQLISPQAPHNKSHSWPIETKARPPFPAPHSPPTTTLGHCHIDTTML